MFTLNKFFLLIAFIYLLGFFAHATYLGKTVYGDGLYYYSWVRSAVIDHDLNFQNDYELLGITQGVTATGMLGNIYPVGPALFWSPIFLMVHNIILGNGTELPYQLAVGAVSVLFAVFGLILLHRLLRQFADEIPSILAVLSIAGASNLLFYGSIDTVNSHAISFCMAVVYLTLLSQPKKQWFAIGATLGVIGLVRTQDLIYGILLFVGHPGPRAGIQFFENRFRIKSGMTFSIGLFLAFIPQLLAWQLLYGKFWSSPYLARGYGFNFFHPKIFEVLFSPNNGLFLWTPILILGLIGILRSTFYLLPSRYILALIFLQLYLVASWTTWWQGASFSGRMFISVLPLFALGLSHIYQTLLKNGWKPKKILLIIIAPLSVLNSLLLFSYLLTH